MNLYLTSEFLIGLEFLLNIYILYILQSLKILIDFQCLIKVYNTCSYCAIIPVTNMCINCMHLNAVKLILFGISEIVELFYLMLLKS
jgi:hypothetical protein